jgi:hypothetical protein
VSADLKVLLARVEAAEGPDRELSVRLWYELTADRENLWALSGLNAQRAPRQNTEKTLLASVLVAPREHGFVVADDHYTASLDASLALCERTLGIAWFEVGGPTRTPSAHLFRARIGGTGKWISAKTPALALLAAMLKRLSAQAGIAAA